MSEVSATIEELNALYVGKLASAAYHCNCGACDPPTPNEGEKGFIANFRRGVYDTLIMTLSTGSEFNLSEGTQYRIFLDPNSDEETVFHVRT